MSRREFLEQAMATAIACIENTLDLGEESEDIDEHIDELVEHYYEYEDSLVELSD